MVKKDTKDIIKGALVNFTGVLVHSLNILLYIFLTRVYGAEVVGIYVFSRSTIDILSKLGIVGLDNGVLTLAAKADAEKNDEKLYRIIGQSLFIGVTASVVLTVVIWFFFAGFLDSLYSRMDLDYSLRIMGLGILPWTLTGILLFATRAKRIMKYQVYVKNALEPLVIFLFAYPFSRVGMGEKGLALAFFLSASAGGLASILFYSKEFSMKKTLKYLFSGVERKQLLKFVLPIGLYDLSWLLLQKVDLYILGRFVNPAVVGIYSMAQNASVSFKKVRQSFDPIMIPVIAASHQLKDKGNLLHQYQNVTRWILILNTTFFGLALFAGDSIMGLFGEDFRAGSLAFVILTGSVLINTVLGVSELFILIEKPLINFINTIITISIAAGLCFVLVPLNGMIGASSAILLSFVVMNIIRLLEVYFMYKLHPFTQYHLKAFVAAVPAMAVIYYFKLHFVPAANIVVDLLIVLLFAILYYMTMLFLGMAQEERAIGRKLFKLCRISYIPRSLR